MRTTRLGTSVLAAVVATVLGCAPPQEPTGTAAQFVVCPAGATLEGIDVSEYQGTINWTAVHGSGHVFAIARVSDGTGHLDPTFATNWSGIRGAGMVRGAYQFFEPAEDPVAQADLLLTHMGPLGPGDLPPTIDVEVSGGLSPSAVASAVRAWVDHVQMSIGRAPMIYTSPGLWGSLVGSSAFGSDPLWVANWGVSCPSLPSGWSNWVVWQHADNGSVAGISGAVDLDTFNGDMTALNMFANNSTTPVYGGTFVAQSFPYASVGPVMVHAGSSVAAFITMRNSGTANWDGNTHLATTQPRDRVDPFFGPGWLSNNRPAGVSGTVAPGGMFQFNFSFNPAPTMAPGMYTEYFGMVQEGVTWFSAPGQLGPPDNQLEAIVQVLPPLATDAGTPTDAGVTDAGATDAGATDANPPTDATANDAGGSDAGGSDVTSSSDGAARRDASDGGDGGTGVVTAGCGCTVPCERHRDGSVAVGALLGVIAVVRQRRSHRP